MSRPISKGTIIGILFAVIVLFVILYQTFGLRQYECEVCMELDGRTQCKKVRGENEQQAMQTAKENACAEISSGRTQNMRCNQLAPTSVNCKHL